jgi:MYXO-CTERM domain-containing protein
LDSLDALLAGGKHGPAVVPGRPAESLLVKRTELPLEVDGHMPPKDKPQLTPSERALLASFVRGLAPHAGSVAEQPRPPSPEAPDELTTADASVSEPAAPPEAAASSTTPITSKAAPTLAADDAGPPDPELVARLPARVDLFAMAVSALLAERCAKCHDGKFPAGNLSVADRAALLRGGNDGPAVVPGNLETSTLWQRVSLPLSDGEHMPPDDEPQLAADELALLRAFILNDRADGATVATAELSAGAVRALRARAPAASPPPAAAPRTAGCGACTVRESAEPPVFPGFGALAVGLALLIRRRSRRSGG